MNVYKISLLLPWLDVAKTSGNRLRKLKQLFPNRFILSATEWTVLYFLCFISHLATLNTLDYPYLYICEFSPKSC